MNTARRPWLKNGAAFETRRMPRRCREWLVLLLLPAAASTTPVSAETLYTLSGWIQPAARPYDVCGEYVLMNDPLDRVRAILADPDHRFVHDLPARFRLQAAITQPRGPRDEPVFRIVHQATDASGSSSPDATGSEGWTAVTSDLYAAAINVVPRLSSFIGDDRVDADGDGAPDIRDEFPCRPEEWQDTDDDGTGNNADPDDDNDGMSDSYELLNGLNPFLADAAGDADGDGITNGEEARAGTLANDRSSFFILTSDLDPEAGRLTVHWQGLTTRIYALETANSPSGPWQTVFSGFRPAADGNFSHTMELPPGSRLFLRATATAP